MEGSTMRAFRTSADRRALWTPRLTDIMCNACRAVAMSWRDEEDDEGERDACGSMLKRGEVLSKDPSFCRPAWALRIVCRRVESEAGRGQMSNFRWELG